MRNEEALVESYFVSRSKVLKESHSKVVFYQSSKQLYYHPRTINNDLLDMIWFLYFQCECSIVLFLKINVRACGSRYGMSYLNLIERYKPIYSTPC